MNDRLAMIHAHSLSKKFGRILAVDSIDFEIGQGQVVGFLGPNGAGKTTTIRMIAGFLPPTAGRVDVDGNDVQRHRRRVRRQIGYLPESTPLYTEMRVGEFLLFRARLFGMPRAKRRRSIDMVIQRCWLGEVRRRPIGQLSRGFRQRVGLAAALLHQPPLLILDEPTVGLDPNQIREFRALIRELAGRHTILLSTHILPEVEVTCDAAMMIARGRIRAQGTIDELRTMAARRCRYVVEVNSTTADYVLSKLTGIREVQQVPIDETWRRLTITPDDSAGDIRELIAQSLADHGCLAREIHREAPSLEQMFVKIVADAEADWAARNEGSGSIIKGSTS